MQKDNLLRFMQKMIEKNYKKYRLGKISEKEYLIKIKPIDKVIDKIEMSVLLNKLGVH